MPPLFLIHFMPHSLIILKLKCNIWHQPHTTCESAATVVVYRLIVSGNVQVCTKLRCSAEQFKWLWAIRSIIERIMLRECRTVAETFVEYAKKVAKEGLEKMVWLLPLSCQS
jgi:hypothetical protein